MSIDKKSMKGMVFALTKWDSDVDGYGYSCCFELNINIAACAGRSRDIFNSFIVFFARDVLVSCRCAAFTPFAG